MRNDIPCKFHTTNGEFFGEFKLLMTVESLVIVATNYLSIYIDYHIGFATYENSDRLLNLYNLPVDYF